MPPEQAGGHPSQFWVARGEAQQRGQLQTGIPQPHGGDVAGDHPGFFTLLAQIDRGGGDVGQEPGGHLACAVVACRIRYLLSNIGE